MRQRGRIAQRKNVRFLPGTVRCKNIISQITHLDLTIISTSTPPRLTTDGAFYIASEFACGDTYIR